MRTWIQIPTSIVLWWSWWIHTAFITKNTVLECVNNPLIFDYRYTARIPIYQLQYVNANIFIIQREFESVFGFFFRLHD
jgi:hypothetical protein